MKLTSMRAFREELLSIKEAGFMTNVGNKIVHTMKSGWNFGSEMPGGGWLGEGIKPAKSAIGKAYEYATSLGGATRHLPVGPKALTVGFGAASLPSALKKDDPSGKSRLERLGSLAGGTAAGIATAPFGLAGSLAGGIAGDVVGGKLGKAVSKRLPKKRSKSAPDMVREQPRDLPPLPTKPQGYAE